MRCRPWLLLLPFALCACEGEAPWRAPLAGEAHMLRRAVDDLRRAIDQRDGGLAKIRFTISSLGTIDRARRAALRSGAADLRSRSPVLQVRALTLRLRYGKALDDLMSELIERLVADGAFPLPTDFARLGSAAMPVEVRGDEARYRVVAGEEPDFITLRRESGAWRFEIESIDRALDREWRADTGEAAILARVGQLAGNAVDAAIWQPLR